MSAAEPRSTTQYRRWLCAKISELTALHELETDDQLWEYAETIVDESARRAALLGQIAVYDASLKVSHPVTSYAAVRFLSECLTAMDQTQASAASDMLTAKDVAQCLGISERSVYRRRLDGTLPEPLTVGRSVRWRRTDIEQWASSN